jgi:hypothetical protein
VDETENNRVGAVVNTDEIVGRGRGPVIEFGEIVTIPNTAIQVSQAGSFVFVVKDGVAAVQPVKVARVLDGEAVIESGLDGGETVVTEGQLQLTNGSRVNPRQPKAGS